LSFAKSDEIYSDDHGKWEIKEKFLLENGRESPFLVENGKWN
jgi:hypothetical protein